MLCMRYGIHAMVALLYEYNRSNDSQFAHKINTHTISTQKLIHILSCTHTHTYTLTFTFTEKLGNHPTEKYQNQTIITSIRNEIDVWGSRFCEQP